jgi:hypothetical protein
MKRMALILVFFPALLLAQEIGPGRGDGARVRIGILSRPLRLVREGSLRGIRLAFPPGAVLSLHEGPGRPVDHIDFFLEEGRVIVRAGGGSALEGDRLVVAGGEDDATFTAEIDGQARRYPLPLEITRSGELLQVIVSEEPGRYAADSARAEYGPVGDDGAEALGALAMLIDAGQRCAAPRHLREGFDFCDLTHCQVYRGRLTAGMGPGGGIRCGPGDARFFFHARCGGATLDARVFGNAPAAAGVQDRLSWSGETLCGDTWESSLWERELAEILLKEAVPRTPLRTSLEYSRGKMAVRFTCNGIETNYAPESFRLAVNRVKGWSFIKSNNYGVTSEKSAGTKIYRFRGSGLGHGVGFCQTGALALARRGYSRHEILAHYYPGIGFAGNEEPEGAPGLSFMVFSLYDGAVERASHDAFVHRSVPAGSLFKLIVALYLARERPDLLTGWRHTCPGVTTAPGLPRCWHPVGHGELDCARALAHSCNAFFASLHETIDPASFRAFVARFSGETGITLTLPQTGSGEEWARLLAGLDSRVRFTVADLARLARFLAPGPSADVRLGNARRRYPPAALVLIRRALADTMRSGTAAQEDGTAGDLGAAWGKTATMADGTNRLVSYGIFLGGDAGRGIVAVLRGGRGHDAALSAIRLLEIEGPRQGEMEENAR